MYQEERRMLARVCKMWTQGSMSGPFGLQKLRARPPLGPSRRSSRDWAHRIKEHQTLAPALVRKHLMALSA